jgi:eukaryotic-like serine/threonine-protein kinase
VLEPDAPRKERLLQWPRFLPDGDHFLYLSRNQDAGKDGIRVGALNSRDSQPLVQATSNATYAAPGFLLFNRQQTLLAQPFDAGSRQLAGDPFPVAEQLEQFVVTAGVNYSVSGNGTLAYRRTASNNVQISWFNREGRKIAAVGAPGDYRQYVLSPDGRRVVVERNDQRATTRDLWLLELTSGIFSRLTFDPGNDADPAWAPDSKTLAFTSNRKGVTDIYKKEIGGGSEHVLLESKENKYPEDWLADGSVIYINMNGRTIFRQPPGAAAKPEPLYQTEFDTDEPHVSPDGRWIAFASNESGRWEIYTRRRSRRLARKSRFRAAEG